MVDRRAFSACRRRYFKIVHIYHVLIIVSSLAKLCLSWQSVDSYALAKEWRVEQENALKGMIRAPGLPKGLRITLSEGMLLGAAVNNSLGVAETEHFIKLARLRERLFKSSALMSNFALKRVNIGMPTLDSYDHPISLFHLSFL